MPAPAEGRRCSPPRLDGDLHFDQAARDAAAEDFGHIVERTPEGDLLTVTLARGRTPPVLTDYLEAALRSNGQWLFHHPWLTTFVGDARVEDVVVTELDRLDPPADLGPFGQVVLSPIHTRVIDTPVLRLPADALSSAFNLIRTPPTGDSGEARRLVRANRATYRRVTGAGGVLYPVSALPLSPGGWRRHFGPAFATLAEAKRRHDPGRMLTPATRSFRADAAQTRPAGTVASSHSSNVGPASVASGPGRAAPFA